MCECVCSCVRLVYVLGLYKVLLEQEVNTLLRKEAIEVVPPLERESGFYSRYFIVLKKDGGVVSDFRSASAEPLSHATEVQDAHAQTGCVSDQVQGLVCHDRSKRCIFPCLHPSSTQEAPEVCFRGEAYQYRVLPFGLALSPRTFTKCVDAALAPLQLQGIRILNYIDDWLILAQSEQTVVRHRDVVLTHMKELGLRLNAKKSVLSPLQRTIYLGVVWDAARRDAESMAGDAASRSLGELGLHT